jgi:hypothetical protein
MQLGRQSAAWVSVLFASMLVSGCGPQTAAPTPQLVKVFVTSAASAQLSRLYSCSTPSTAIDLADPQSAEITLRLGAPAQLVTPAFQVGTDEVVVIVSAQSSLSSLTLDQVRSIFLGQVSDWQAVGGPAGPIQVWTYAPGEDIQQIFVRSVMKNQPTTSLARLAVSAPNMSQSVAGVPGSIGYLSRSLMTTMLRELYPVTAEPVLAITSTVPERALQGLIACLQSP